MVECALCGKKLSGWAYMCSACFSSGYANEPWAKALIDAERDWRRMNKSEDKRDTFSEIEVNSEDGSYNGWDIIDGDIGYNEEHPESITTGTEDSLDIYDDTTERRIRRRIKSIVGKGEMNALEVQRYFGHRKFSSEEGAELLSEMEGKRITPEAFRRRLSDARKKLRENGIYPYTQKAKSSKKVLKKAKR